MSQQYDIALTAVPLQCQKQQRMIDWELFGRICGKVLPIILTMVLGLYLLTNINSDKTMAKRLYSSRTDRKIAGICGGLANYFDIDPTIIRLGWLIFAFCGGGGVFAYILALIVVPEEPYNSIDNQ